MTPKAYAHRLKKYRIEAGYTQRGAAKLLGVTPTQLMEWEKGRRMPQGRHLLKLSVLYQRVIDDMYYDLKMEGVKEILENKRKYGNWGTANSP